MTSVYCAAEHRCGDKLAAWDSLAHAVELIAAPAHVSQYFSETVAKSPRAIKNGTDFDFRKFKVCVIFSHILSFND
jgi:hypothetical protein